MIFITLSAGFPLIRNEVLSNNSQFEQDQGNGIEDRFRLVGGDNGRTTRPVIPWPRVEFIALLSLEIESN